MWLLFAFLSAGFAGITAILAKIGVRDIDSDLATALRTSVVLVFAWLMALLSGGIREIGTLSAQSLLFLMLSGLSTGASWICYFKALQMGRVNRVAAVDKSSTVLTIVLAALLFGEPFTWLTAVCAVTLLAGTLLMLQKSPEESTSPEKSSWLLYAVLSALFASLTTILGKLGVESVDSNLATAIRTIFVLLMAWGIVFAGKKQKGIHSISRKNSLFLCLSGIATGLSWLCYYRALKDGIAGIVAPVDKLSILLTAVFSKWVLHEPFGKRAVIGLLLLTAGTLGLLL